VQGGGLGGQERGAVPGGRAAGRMGGAAGARRRPRERRDPARPHREQPV